MAKYVSQTLSYCASESNKFTSSNARQSKRLNGERENMIEKKWVRQFYLTWKKFCLCDREIAQQKVINYETIARRKKAQDCVCIYCIFGVLPYVTVYAVTYRLWPSSSPSDSKLQQFFIFSPAFFLLIILFIFIFPYISFAFSSTSAFVHSRPAGRFKIDVWFFYHIHWRNKYDVYWFCFDPVWNKMHHQKYGPYWLAQIEWNCPTFHSDDFFMLKQCP